MKQKSSKLLNHHGLRTESFLAIWLYEYKFFVKEFHIKSLYSSVENMWKQDDLSAI